MTVYSPTIWKDNESDADALLLNKLEQGVKITSETAEAALSTATSASSGASSAKTEATSAKTLATEAKTKATTAEATASTAASEASAAKTEATNAKTEAANAKAAAVAATKVEVNSQNGAYTLIAADAGKCIEFNKATTKEAITIPLNASVPFPIGTVIEFCQVNTGQLEIKPASPEVIFHTSTGTTTTRAQWSTVSARKRAENEWVGSGDFT